MSVTIKDVAKLASVAPSTVSRVIANSPRISEKTKVRVKEAMEHLGYHPNFNARSLANKNTQALGIVLPSAADIAFQNPFFPEVLRGISTKAQEEKYVLNMSTGQSNEQIFNNVVQMVQGRRTDGVLLLYSQVEDEIIAYLQKQKFPFALIGKPFKDVNTITHVDNDNYKASKTVAEYLILLGHERIAFVGGNLDLVVTIERLEGYEAALRQANIKYRDDYVVHEVFLKEGGQDAVVELMSLSDPPTALVVADDIMALGVLRMLDNMGMSVPEDISIISFNNVMISELASPPLTTVDINIFSLGYEATKCLIHNIHFPASEAKRVIVPHKLIRRESCQKYTITTGR